MGRKERAGDVVRSSLVSAVDQLIEHDVLRHDVTIEPETVHQARVAIRRLRSDLRTFTPLLDDRWVRAWRADLAVPARLLGAVRDLDVVGFRLLHLGEQVGDPLAWLHEVLDEQRQIALAAVVADAQGAAHRELLDRLVAQMADPLLSEEAAGPAGVVFGHVAARAWKPLRRAARGAIRAGVDDVPVERLHEVRIRAKRFRYAAEATGRVDPDARRHAKRVAALQDELGVLHDVAVTEGWLGGRLAGSDVHQAYLLGQLVAREHQAMAGLRRSWLPLWQRVDRPRLRRWMG